MTGRGRPTVSGPLDGGGRRSIYLAVRRNFLNPMFLAFDYPATGTTTGRRGTSNVPAQALALLNNPFVSQQCDVWAKRMESRGERLSPSQADESLIETLYETAFSRPPTKSGAAPRRGASWELQQPRERLRQPSPGPLAPNCATCSSTSKSSSTSSENLPLFRSSGGRGMLGRGKSGRAFSRAARAVRRTSLVLRGAGA